MNVNGFPLRCPHCGGASFERGRVELRADGLIFSGFNWFDDAAQSFACRSCGRIELFRQARTTESDLAGKTADCPRCGTFIPATGGVCPNCGEPK